MPALDRPHADNAVALAIPLPLLTIWVFGSKRLAEALDGVELTTSSHFSLQVSRSTSERNPLYSSEILTYPHGIDALVGQTSRWLLGRKANTLLESPLEGESPPNPPDIEASSQIMQERIGLTQIPRTKVAGHNGPSKAETNLERLDKLRYVTEAHAVLDMAS